MFRDIIKQSIDALKRNPMRSFLTMLGIVWGIVAVTMLIAYGSSFRALLVTAFNNFGKSAVIAWPGQTSEQAGGERAGKRVRFEMEDVEAVRLEATVVKEISPETVRWHAITYNERLQNTAIRGVYPNYGEMRNQVPSEGRWLSPEDIQERRRVVFLGGRLREKLFGGQPAVGETVRISNVRFTVIGVMDRDRKSTRLNSSHAD